MMVILLTLEQKEEITGRQYAPDSYFNPIQDINDNWIISQEEADQCYEEYGWLKTLPLIEYQPKPSDDPMI